MFHSLFLKLILFYFRLSHKTDVFKKEKKKNQWLLEKEKEKFNEKIKRNEEASKVYYKWLRKKLFSENKNSNIIMEDKPPWTPPGKANSLSNIKYE